jgi:DNA-binding GntR family transcriptional regulator
MPGTLEPLQSHSIVDTIYQTLRREIASGSLPPGHRLHQAEIAQQLGTSRTPVREALARLTADHLVEFQPNRGFFVATMSEERTRAAVEVRILFEPVVARLAAERQPPEPLARMRAAIDAEQSATDPWSAYEASRAFHLALADASDNEFLQRMAAQLWSADLGRPLYQAYVSLEGSDWIPGDAEEHSAILRAVIAGDGELAERVTRVHLDSARHYMGTVIDLTQPVHGDATSGQAG